MLVEVLKDLGDGTPIRSKIPREQLPNADLLEKYRYIRPAEKPLGWKVIRPLPHGTGNYTVGTVLALDAVFEPERLQRLGYIKPCFELSEELRSGFCQKKTKGGNQCRRKPVPGFQFCGLPSHREEK